MKKILLIAATCVAAWSASAQDEHLYHAPKRCTEARTYYEQTIQPTLKAKHTAMDAKFSKEDLAFIQQKRTEAKQLRDEQQALRQQMRSMRCEGKKGEDIKAQFAPQWEQIRTKRQKLAESIKPFMERNKAILQATADDLKTHAAQWDKDLATKCSDEPTHGKGHHRGKGHHGKHRQHDGKHFGKMTRFVLWDGTQPPTPPQRMGKPRTHRKGERGQLPTAALTTEAFPNPATQEVTIRFTIGSPTSKALLQISDANGKIIKTQTLTNLETGTYTMQTTVSDLADGLYFYTITTDKQHLTKTLMIQKS